MNGSLEARLAALEEVTKDVLPYAEWLRVWHYTEKCCMTGIMRMYGCQPECLHGSAGEYFYHGTSEPTVETLQTSQGGEWDCPTCGRGWMDISVIHPTSLVADFDEETERARLMTV